ncbi:hypothetical protein BDQ12DRAFT_684753 [Crucibulum laeve]|uniref:Uncharacterized protein n=1 Tax=Crucibulum laeve TaxID=68775 RepID=A0A5C3LYD1_9AGAR|nr:hypothetical protein BDQ12DRAFT_684753 [Crucibulum laeve]
MTRGSPPVPPPRTRCRSVLSGGSIASIAELGNLGKTGGRAYAIIGCVTQLSSDTHSRRQQVILIIVTSIFLPCTVIRSNFK